ncbi:calcium-binding protein [Cypionkella sp. TWP1-2-1b2]|uniref:calcium-binding protein n=1 Tax=Cypionkella sp. TWP1-2-1b2 TaxID=2804675 RepID=UPI003CEA54A6
MPVISTSVSGTATALQITTSGTYFVTAPTYLETTLANVVGISSGAGQVGLTLAGALISGNSFYTIFDSGISNTLALNVLASGYITGGGILNTGRLLQLSNAGTLFGFDIGITAGNFADQIVNTGVINAGTAYALILNGGDDLVTNTGQIIGNIDLGSGNDSLYGGDGSIIGSIFLGDGDDLIDLRHANLSGDVTGSGGNDVYIVDDGAFNLFEAASQGTDLVKSTVSYELALNFENLQLLGAGDINGTGNTLANTLTGNAGDNRLHGFSGGDRLFGGAGDDRLYGDTGNDTLSGGIGDDTLFGGANNDSVVGDSGADRLIGGAGQDVMTGDVGVAGGYDDVFIFQKITDSTYNSLSDRITDFHVGEDTIDLSAIDARSATAINDAFSFITTAFTSVAGQVRLQANGADTYILGDVNGDGVADFRIFLTGNLALTAADFIL